MPEIKIKNTFPLDTKSIVKLQSPNVFEIGNYATFPFNYTSGAESLEISRTMHVSKIFGYVEGVQKIQLKIADITPPPHIMNQYLNAEDLLMRCVRNAELVNTALRGKILQLICKAEDERIEVNKMDFMKLSTYLFDYLKKNLELVNKLFQDGQSFKHFRSLLNNFILDRNKYTHGVLHFLLDTNKYFISYKEGLKNVAAYIDADVLKSFNVSYLLLVDFLNEFQI